MVGFTEKEVSGILRDTGIGDGYTGILREHYNGYLFNVSAENKIYNSNLLMYFIKEYMFKGRLPDNLVDSNVISDYTRITELFNLFEDREERRRIIESIVGGRDLEGWIQDRIGPLVPTPAAEGGHKWGFTRDDFLSLLYYLGLLTISDASEDETLFVAPNYCISSVYAQYYLSYLYRRYGMGYDMGMINQKIVRDLHKKNDMAKFKETVELLLRGIANEDYKGFDEKYVKLMMYSIVKYSQRFLVKSEYEIEGKRADLVLLPNNILASDYYYIFEIKYLKASEYTEHRLEAKPREATEQVRQYAETAEMKSIPNLRKYVVVAVKDELKVFEEVG
jgi:hypothetical protein